MARRGAVGDLTKEAQWRKHVGAQPGSGLSVRAYCRAHGVKEPAFYWWRGQLARRDARKPGAAFVPVRVTADDATPGRAAGSTQSGLIEIALTGGQRIRLRGPVDGRALAAVLGVLEEGRRRDAGPEGEGRPC